MPMDTLFLGHKNNANTKIVNFVPGLFDRVPGGCINQLVCYELLQHKEFYADLSGQSLQDC